MAVRWTDGSMRRSHSNIDSSLLRKRSPIGKTLKSAVILAALLLQLLATESDAADSIERDIWRVSTAYWRVILEPAEDASLSADTAWAEVFPGPLPIDRCKLTLYNERGDEVPHLLLWRAPGQSLTILFDNSSNADRYSLYFSNSGYHKRYRWKPEAGLWLETRPSKHKSGGFERFTEFESMWNAQEQIQGRTLQSRIFHGFNPHGVSYHYLSHYSGWFRVKEAGRYRFATLSDDASFLLINGTGVAQWPGAHDAGGGRRAEHDGNIRLTKGRHRLDYWHAQGGGHSRCAVAWQPPGAERPAIMPEKAFVPLAHYVVKDFKSAESGRVPARSTWRNLHSLYDKGHALVETEFEAASNMDGDSYTWQIDDGTVLEGSKVRHLFLRPGLRQVRLTIERDGRRLAELPLTVDVRPIWSDRRRWSDELYEDIRARLLALDLNGKPIRDVLNLTNIARLTNDRKLLDAAGNALLARPEATMEHEPQALLVCARNWKHYKLRDFARAKRALQHILDFEDADKALRIDAGLELADLRVNVKNAPGRARELLDGLRERISDDERERRRQILLADCALVAGDPVRARDILATVDTRGERDAMRGATLEALRLETIRSFVERAEYSAAHEALDRLLAQQPELRLKPTAALLAIDIHFGLGDYHRSRCAAQGALHLAMAQGQRADLLFRLVQIHTHINEMEQARIFLAQLYSEFPLEEATARARERWGNAPQEN